MLITSIFSFSQKCFLLFTLSSANALNSDKSKILAVKCKVILHLTVLYSTTLCREKKWLQKKKDKTGNAFGKDSNGLYGFYRRFQHSFSTIVAASAPTDVFSGVIFISTLHNILSKPLVPLLHDYYQDNAQL